jgi:hypothetical protein
MAGRVAYHPEAFSLDLSDRKQKRIEDPAHLAFIRKLPSVISGAYGCEACHIRAGSPMHRKPSTGIARKPDDAWTLPMLPAEHRAQHGMNELAFYDEHGIDPFELASKLYHVTGDVEAGTRIIAEMRRP